VCNKPSSTTLDNPGIFCGRVVYSNSFLDRPRGGRWPVAFKSARLVCTQDRLFFLHIYRRAVDLSDVRLCLVSVLAPRPNWPYFRRFRVQNLVLLDFLTSRCLLCPTRMIRPCCLMMTPSPDPCLLARHMEIAAQAGLPSGAIPLACSVYSRLYGPRCNSV
jgi:hypothetical protein